MTAPQTVSNWSISPNNRRVHTTLVDQVGFWAVTNKTHLLANNWTLVWSSDGTTGPSGSGDNTDRIGTDPTKFATRATVAASPQSWFVVQNPEGVQLLFAFQGASDDIVLVAGVTSGGFTLAVTTTHQPTASTWLPFGGAKSVVGTSVSEDRLTHVWCSADGLQWRSVVYGSSVLRSCLAYEKATRLSIQSTFPEPYVGASFLNLSNQYLNATANNTQVTPLYMGGTTDSGVGNLNNRGWSARVFTAATSRLNRLAGGRPMCAHPVATSTANGNVQSTGDPQAVFASTYCASLGGTGALTWPITLWGEKAANLDGPWATPIDWYQVITTSITNPALTDMMPGYEVGDTPGSSPPTPRTNWWVVLGACALWPWKNVAATMQVV
jgi:hypothetical protein